MSKRLKSAQASTDRLNKRSNSKPEFGAEIYEDSVRSSANTPTSAALSTRYLNTSNIPSLATLSARAFVNGFRLLSDEYHWILTREMLKQLPDSLRVRLFAMLQEKHPKLLSHTIITTYFMVGNAISLSGELGVTQDTLSALSRQMGNHLRTLVLIDLNKQSDVTFSKLVGKLHVLEVLNLRCCVKVGPETVAAAAKACPRLKYINLSSTSVTAMSLGPLLIACGNLEVLKLAAVQNLKDNTCSKLLDFLTLRKDTAPLGKLRSLKLRHNFLSDTSIHYWLLFCPSLERLDLSFTLVRHLPDLIIMSPLEELALTSTNVTGAELSAVVRCLPKLKKLLIGALGVRPGTSAGINTSGTSLSDDSLVGLTDALEGCPDIESINLVQNNKLGTSRRPTNAIADFIRRVGRKCTYLNIAGISSLQSSDLVGFIPEDTSQEYSPLRTLVLNKTSVGDDAAPWVSSCKSLETLEVAETKFTKDGVFTIINACPKLVNLNLTGCRGINVVDRRRFFEVWEKGSTA